MDDSIEANVSTFAAEMRETAFILRNIDRRSMYVRILMPEVNSLLNDV
jgi:DNA mismatch repair protein MSH4